MTVKINDKGNYELFETTRGHHILVLNGERWFAWVEGQQGEILVHTDSDHEKDHTIQEGEFYIAERSADAAGQTEEDRQHRRDRAARRADKLPGAVRSQRCSFPAQNAASY